ncbi:MAG: YdcF family protein [Holophagaceae bacterium]|nr:YdcF family protein [Holophagaceae bacterium]
MLWFCVKFPLEHKQFEPKLLPVGLPALVLGASVKSSGEPSQVLEGRLQVALELYREKKVAWILVSGDNRTQHYNEPLAMSRWLIKNGVPEEKIILDFEGRRTYDSIIRAKMVYAQEKIVIVTSEFHLPRAIYLAKRFGIDAYGIPSGQKSIKTLASMNFWFREYLARHKAVWDIWFPPSPIVEFREDTTGSRSEN